MGYQNQQHNIAILFFTRTAAEEARFKTYAHHTGYRKNYRIAREFIDHTRRILDDSEFPVFTITEQQQQGDTFGERFKNAYLQLFRNGYDKVLALGNDCPALTIDDVRNAVSQLKFHDYVVGPASDGGTYLLGISKACFRAISFQQLSWETNDLLPDLLNYIKRYKFSVQVLDELYDIDDHKDFYDLIYGDHSLELSLEIRHLLLALISLLTGWLVPFNTLPVFKDNQLLPTGNNLRAPPRFSFFQ